MALSPEEIAAAVKMHTFVRGFEKQRGATTWASAMAGITVAISINAGHIFRSGNLRERLFLLGGFVAVVLFIMLIQHLSRLRYKREQVLLPVLERDHAKELPWIQEERTEAKVKAHLAAVHAIEQEIDRGHAV
jgi:hypothetical protein